MAREMVCSSTVYVFPFCFFFFSFCGHTCRVASDATTADEIRKMNRAENACLVCDGARLSRDPLRDVSIGHEQAMAFPPPVFGSARSLARPVDVLRDQPQQNVAGWIIEAVLLRDMEQAQETPPARPHEIIGATHRQPARRST